MPRLTSLDEALRNQIPRGAAEDVVKILEDNPGVNVDEPDNSGARPLFLAAMRADKSIITAVNSRI